MAEKQGAGVRPAATLRLMMTNLQQNPALKWTPGAPMFLGVLAAIVECAEAQDARIAQLEGRLRGMDEVPDRLPAFGTP